MALSTLSTFLRQLSQLNWVNYYYLFFLKLQALYPYICVVHSIPIILDPFRNYLNHGPYSCFESKIQNDRVTDSTITGRMGSFYLAFLETGQL